MEKRNTKKINKVVLSEHVKDRILNDILQGKYQPGDRLIECSLAEAYGVSQSPVREALKILAEMGLVSIEPYKGTTVRKISSREIWEMFTVRAVLESMAAGMAAEVITPRECARLEKIIENMVEAAKRGDNENRFRLNDSFHEEILRISNHQLVYKLSKSMRFARWSHMKGMLGSTDPVDITQRHRIILDALRAHDKALAEKLMLEHIQSNIPVMEEDL